MYKKQQGLTGTTLQSAAITVAMTPLNCMYCPSRRPVQTYPQQTGLIGYGDIDDRLIAARDGPREPGPGGGMIWDASATTLTTSVATGLTSVARSDYAGNGFSYSSYPQTGAGATFFGVLLAEGEYWAANDPVNGLANVTFAEALKALLSVQPAGQGGIFYYGLSTTMAQIKDGTSNTYLCGEKYIDANHYLDGLDGTPYGQYSGYDGDCICDYCGYDSDMIRFVGSNTRRHRAPPATRRSKTGRVLAMPASSAARTPACATWPSAMARCIRSATGLPRPSIGSLATAPTATPSTPACTNVGSYVLIVGNVLAGQAFFCGCLPRCLSYPLIQSRVRSMN